MSNNKKVWLAMGIFLGAVLVLCIFMISFMPRGRFHIGGGSAQLRHTTNFNIDERTALELTVYSENVYFLQSESDELVIKEYYRSETRKATIQKSDQAVTIRGSREFSIWFFGIGFTSDSFDRVEIYLPKNYAGNVKTEVSSGTIKSDLSFTGERLSFASSSGSIHLHSLTAENINIKASSGAIKVDEIVGDATIKSNSGSIKISGIKGDATVNASSGSITIDRLEGMADINASSGGVRVMGIIGGVTAKASSGTVRLDVVELKGNINATSSSGSVNIDLPKDSAFRFQAETSSGSIKTDFDGSLSFNSRGKSASGTIGNDSLYQVSAKATSGSVRINR